MNDSIRGDKCQKREHVCSEKKAQAEEQETQWDGDRHPPTEESDGGVLGKKRCCQGRKAERHYTIVFRKQFAKDLSDRVREWLLLTPRVRQRVKK